MVSIESISVNPLEYKDEDWDVEGCFNLQEYLYQKLENMPKYYGVAGILRSEVETGVFRYFKIELTFNVTERHDFSKAIHMMLSKENNKLLGVIHAMVGMIHNNTF